MSLYIKYVFYTETDDGIYQSLNNRGDVFNILKAETLDKFPECMSFFYEDVDLVNLIKELNSSKELPSGFLDRLGRRYKKIFIDSKVATFGNVLGQSKVYVKMPKDKFKILALRLYVDSLPDSFIFKSRDSDYQPIN